MDCILYLTKTPAGFKLTASDGDHFGIFYGMEQALDFAAKYSFAVYYLGTDMPDI
jgi:hypothetical protein